MASYNRSSVVPLTDVWSVVIDIVSCMQWRFGSWNWITKR